MLASTHDGGVICVKVHVPDTVLAAYPVPYPKLHDSVTSLSAYLTLSVIVTMHYPSAMRTGYMKTAPSLCICQILTLIRVSGTGKQVNRGRRKVEHRAAVEDGSFGASIAISSIQRHNHVASIELTPVNSRTYARPSSGLVHQPLTLLYPLNSRTLWRLTHLWRLSNSNNHSRSFASNGNEMRSLSMHWVSPNHPAGSRNS